jgi:hypothetical protein
VPNLDVVFPGKYLKPSDLTGKEVTVTIEKVIFEPIGQSKEPRLQIKFVGRDKLFVVNKTNAHTIANLYGRDTDNWVGKRIVLYPTTTSFGGQTVDCIRVKAPPRAAVPDTAPAAAPAAAPVAAPAAVASANDDMNDAIEF